MSTHTDHARMPDSDETYLRDVLDAAMSGTRPPLDLPESALTRGRRRRSHRRIGLGGVAVAATVLAAVAVPWALGGDGSRTTDSSRLIATEPPAPRPERPIGWWDMPATEMIATVEAILPDDVAVTAPGPLEADTPGGGPATGWIDAEVAGPDGPGSLNVILSPNRTSGQAGGEDGLDSEEALDLVRSREGAGTEGGEPDRTSCDEELTGRTRCSQIHDEDGTVIGRRLTNRIGAVVMTQVVLVRDGGTVYAASVNSLADKPGAGSAISAEEPPLTLDALEALVRSDAWVSYEP